MRITSLKKTGLALVLGAIGTATTGCATMHDDFAVGHGAHVDHHAAVGWGGGWGWRDPLWDPVWGVGGGWGVGGWGLGGWGLGSRWGGGWGPGFFIPPTVIVKNERYPDRGYRGYDRGRYGDRYGKPADPAAPGEKPGYTPAPAYPGYAGRTAGGGHVADDAGYRAGQSTYRGSQGYRGTQGYRGAQGYRGGYGGYRSGYGGYGGYRGGYGGYGGYGRYR